MIIRKIIKIFYPPGISVLFFLLWIVSCINTKDAYAADEVIRYVAIGDSYTIATGAPKESSWPILLTNRLRLKGIRIELVANLAVAGKTTEQIIKQQLPAFGSAHPTFATVLAGANDIIHGIDAETFGQQFATLLDGMLEVLGQKDHLLVLTLPDLARTPSWSVTNRREEFIEKVKIFNQKIRKAAEERHLPIVEMYSLSQKTFRTSSLMSSDGAHLSANGNASWAKFIVPKAYRILKDRSS